MQKHTTNSTLMGSCQMWIYLLEKILDLYLTMRNKNTFSG